MRGRLLLVLVAALMVVLPGATLAATPTSGTVSPTSSPTWTGGPFAVANPSLTNICIPTLPPCDTYRLTIEPPASGEYLVEIKIGPKTAGLGDDWDLYVYDSEFNEIDNSATSSASESVKLGSPKAGLYYVVVNPWLITPGVSTYEGSATMSPSTDASGGKAFKATVVDEATYAAGAPANSPARYSGPALRVSASYVGRDASEPTIGVTPTGTAFFAASTFDSLIGQARTETMKSTNGGKSWVSVQPSLPTGITTEPGVTLDPYVHVDKATGRVYSIDLYVGCSWLIYSDADAATGPTTWKRNAIACGSPVNDHHTVWTSGVESGRPDVMFYCFNRVADSSCGRSEDGGDTFLPAGAPAFTGADTSGICGGLHGHITTDNAGRLYLPKGHCNKPRVALSDDRGTTWRRVTINNYIPTADHELSIAADSANNMYVTWWDSRDRLPYLSVSTTRGETWSTPVMIAPPDVDEVNFPTITAGDSGRIAITFPGTVSNNRADDARPWNSYQLVSTNALDASPTFVWTTANPTSDPIHRGDCGPGRCSGMYDFLDIQTSPYDGTFWSTAVDTCTADGDPTGDCRTKTSTTTATATATEDPALAGWEPEPPLEFHLPACPIACDAEGVAVHQTFGPSLWATKKK